MIPYSVASTSINQSVNSSRSLNVTVLSLAVTFFGSSASSSDNKVVSGERIVAASTPALDEQIEFQITNPEKIQTTYSQQVTDESLGPGIRNRLTDETLKEVLSAQKIFFSLQIAAERLPKTGRGDALYRGCKGEYVKNLQQLLKDTVNPDLLIDGLYGPSTDTAVKEFQHLMNNFHSTKSISVDGIFGPETYGALSECCSHGIPGAYRLSQIISIKVRLPVEERTASVTCHGLIKHFERFRAKAYQDAAGVWTIGYGHTANVKPGQTITAGEASEFLLTDISRAENSVKRLVKVPLRQHEFDALVDFCFNLGEGNLARSTLLKELNSGNYGAVEKELPKWCLCTRNGRKIKLQGLLNRRLSELKLWQAESSCQLSDCLK